MTRVSIVLAAVIGLSAIAATKSDSQVHDATIDALVGTYSFEATTAAVEVCQVTLKRGPELWKDGRILRPIDLASRCRERFSSLRGITHWAAIGGASIALFGGDAVAEISDFSPVQDGTGVYLRGGFPGDARIYELRPLRE